MRNWIKTIKRRYREWNIRLKLAHHALKGTDFVRDAQPGMILTRRSYETDLPDYRRTPEEEHRAALLGRATEAEQLYVVTRDLREAIELGDDNLQQTVMEFARMKGFDGGIYRAVRTLEEKYRERAIRNIRPRLETSRKEWDESGAVEVWTVSDPRLQWRMDITVTARDIARSNDGNPTNVQRAIESAPDEILAQMSNAERSKATP